VTALKSQTPSGALHLRDTCVPVSTAPGPCVMPTAPRCRRRPLGACAVFLPPGAERVTRHALPQGGRRYRKLPFPLLTVVAPGRRGGIPSLPPALSGWGDLLQGPALSTPYGGVRPVPSERVKHAHALWASCCKAAPFCDLKRVTGAIKVCSGASAPETSERRNAWR